MRGSFVLRRSLKDGARLRRNNPSAPAMRALVAGALVALAPICARAEPVTIAALGDSLTAGYGLNLDEAFPARLQDWLRARGHDVVVINAGVTGDTTAGGLSRLDWTLTPDVDAVIVELGGNDLLRAIDPATSRANLDAILTRLEAEGLPALLAGLPAPGNYGVEWKQSFDAMFPDLATKHGAILYKNFLEGLSPGFSMADRSMREAATRLMQSDGLHPNAEGVLRIVEHIGPSVERLIAETARRAQMSGG
jgi:acyl-CoA thioesterase-1